jgi:hypothetical protein
VEYPVGVQVRTLTCRQLVIRGDDYVLCEKGFCSRISVRDRKGVWPSWSGARRCRPPI